MNAREILITNPHFAAKELIVDEFIKYILPPDSLADGPQDITKPPSLIRSIELTYKPGRGQVAKSRRLSNALVNWKAMLLEGVPSVVALGIELVASPTRGFFSALLAFQAWTHIFEVELSEAHADVVKYLWISRQSAATIRMHEVKHEFRNSTTDVELLLSDLAVLGLLKLDDQGGIVKNDVIKI